MSLTTPVAVFIFNRPDKTERVFNAIAKAKPKKLLVIADGPRFPEEVEKCERTRAVIERVDWECEVLTDFSENNLTSPIRCSSGINWVFSEVEDAIILEDDCLPAPSFFYYCQTLLEYYRHDERIMHISGDNFQFGQSRTDYSYYFSRYSHNWGWASWRRAWKHFDIYMKTWPEFERAKMIDSVFEDPHERKYWTGIFTRVFNSESIHWDYAWQYACLSHSCLSIIPNENLVTNIGFGPDATRNIHEESHLALLPTADIWEIKHPPLMVRHRDADTYTFNNIYSRWAGGDKHMKQGDSSLIAKIRQPISSIKRKIKSWL